MAVPILESHPESKKSSILQDRRGRTAEGEEVPWDQDTPLHDINSYEREIGTMLDDDEEEEEEEEKKVA